MSSHQQAKAIGTLPASETHAGRAGALARDALALTKPNIVLMCGLMTLAGSWLAPGHLDALSLVAALLGTSLAVAAANVLNMVAERHTDGLMQRTRSRPLPAGRFPVGIARLMGLSLSVVSTALLGLAVNGLTALLAAAAIAIYVLGYTRLKHRTPLALLVGAIPGAMPPLLGWTAVTGELQAGAWLLFVLLFLWQIPHFIAIALFRKDDYARAGIPVLPLAIGERAARRQALLAAFALVPAGALLAAHGVAGWAITALVMAAGLLLFIQGSRGLGAGATARGPRRLFFATLVYLPLLGFAFALAPLLR